MKKFSIFIITLSAVLFTACSNKAKELKEEAEIEMPLIFYDIAKDPSSVEISSVNPVFSNDSLCILHFCFSAKNGLGIETTNKMEYVYLESGGQKYEAFKILDADSVYQDQATFEKKKVDKIYENLPYESAIYYRAAIFINSNGRVVGDKECEEEIKIPIPTGTGFWELGYYVDEFGDDTPNRFLRIAGKGVFSNSATTGSRMTAYLIVDRKNIAFRFVEYDDHVVKDDETCQMKIKDSYGDVHEITLYNSRDGQMTTYSNSEVKEILMKGGKITISAEMGKYSKSTYLFKMDVSGYDQAYEFISPLKDPWLKEYKEKNEAFLKENAKKTGVVTLPSGLQYKVIKEGNGNVPGESSRVKFHYEGHLLDGTVFDSSYIHGEPATTRVPQLVKGFSEALQHMPVGSTWEIFIPAKLAYEDHEIGHIPPFSTLIFKVELLSIEEFY